MSSFLDILTPQSSGVYSSWAQSASLDTYEHIIPGTTNTSAIVNLVHEDGNTVDSLPVNTTVNFRNWLDEFVSKLDEDSDADGDITQPSAGTSTQSTASDAFEGGLEKRWSSCTKKCGKKRHCTAGCYACKKFDSYISRCQK